MYDYRSRLAHGDNPDFQRDFAILQNPTLALDLLKGVVKATLRYALVEPRLVVDLREC